MGVATLSNPHGIELVDVRRIAPSVFAEHAHESRSRRYAFAPSYETLETLVALGYRVTMVAEGGARREGYKGYTRHMLRMRRIDELGVSIPDVPEIVWINSHDGTSALHFYLGIFTSVCSNGQVVGRHLQRSVVYHRGSLGDVVGAVTKITEVADEQMLLLHDMHAIELNPDERREMALQAITARFGEEGSLHYDPDELLVSKHRQYDRPSLYNTFESIQEHVVRGGMTRVSGRRTTTRAIQNIRQVVEVNLDLWDIALSMFNYKNGLSTNPRADFSNVVDADAVTVL